MKSNRSINSLIGQATIDLLKDNRAISKNDILCYLSRQCDALQISHVEFYNIRNTLHHIDMH